MLRMRSWILCALLLLPLSVMAEPRIDTLAIETQDGDRLFVVEIVDTDRTRAKGLMNRTDLARDHGMLFDFKREKPVSFWMKNTLIPLDMLFANAEGTIIHIHPNAKPHDESPIRSGAPILAVLEINGGLAAELGIRPGDRMRHAIFDRR